MAPGSRQPVRCSGWTGRPSASFTQESIVAARVWSRGGTCSGSSSEQMVMSVSSGKRVDSKVSGVPQVPQKVRTAFGDER